MKIRLVFKKGLDTVGVVEGVKEVRKEHLTLAEIELLVTTLPQLLEKVTGLRVHISEV